MLLRLAALFVFVPLIEFALLWYIADLTGLGFTLSLVIVTGVVGAWLARREGLRCWQGMQRELAEGRLPTDALLDGPMILVAGALLLTPGVLTDLVGFGLLVRPLRQRVKRSLARRMKDRITVVSMSGQPNPFTHDDNVIDVDSQPDEDSP